MDSFLQWAVEERIKKDPDKTFYIEMGITSNQGLHYVAGFRSMADEMWDFCSNPCKTPNQAVEQLLTRYDNQENVINIMEYRR